ncbi:MAG: aspartate 1-decarboxylase [Oscillospiraceae bacterium]|nr:aspartate 1-decarboxylase [Oscillospiraceae bacterium]
MITMLKSKLHRAVVTQADVNYVGSITIDKELMDKVGIYEYEKVSVVDVENGNRFETYVIAGEQGSRIICVNGAAARLVSVGDHVIIMAYRLMEEEKVKEGYEPTVVFLDSNNNPCEAKECKRTAN